MVKSIDDIIENSTRPEEILPRSLESLIFGLHIYDQKSNIKHNLNEHSLEFKVKDKIMNIFVGKHIANKIKKHKIESMLVYSEDLEFAKEDEEPNIQNYIDGVIKLKDEDDTIFDIFDRIFICFKDDIDYTKFVKKILQGED